MSLRLRASPGFLWREIDPRSTLVEGGRLSTMTTRARARSVLQVPDKPERDNFDGSTGTTREYGAFKKIVFFRIFRNEMQRYTNSNKNATSSRDRFVAVFQSRYAKNNGDDRNERHESSRDKQKITDGSPRDRRDAIYEGKMKETWRVRDRCAK